MASLMPGRKRQLRQRRPDPDRSQRPNGLWNFRLNFAPRLMLKGNVAVVFHALLPAGKTLGVIVTATDNVRAHIASENEQRRLRAEGLLPARGGRARPGPSAIDATLPQPAAVSSRRRLRIQERPH